MGKAYSIQGLYSIRHLFLFWLAATLSISFPSRAWSQDALGGPYTADSKTVILMHFDGNLDNASDYYDLPTPGEYGNISFLTMDGAGDFGNQLRLDNDSPNDKSHIRIPDHPALDMTGNWTMEMWVLVFTFGYKENDWRHYPRMIVKPGDPYEEGYYQSNYFLALYGNNKEVGTGYWSDDNSNPVAIRSDDNVIKIGEWFHLAFIRDTSRQVITQLIHQNAVDKTRLPSAMNDSLELIYQDEFNYGEKGLVGPPDLSNQPLFIGLSPANDTLFANFDGFIDELRISNVARTFRDPTDKEPVPNNPFKANLRVKDLNNNSTELTFGRLENATDGYDEGMDILAPPLPPEGAFDARLVNGNRAYLKDIRNLDSKSFRWHIDVQISEGQPVFVPWDVRFAWDPSVLPDTGRIWMKDTTHGWTVNMRADSVIHLSADQFDKPVIIHEISERNHQAHIRYQEGWNLLGVPVAIFDGYYRGLFPAAETGTLFGFEDSYESRDTVRVGSGYWLRFGEDGVSSIEGRNLEFVQTRVKKGWNMISGPDHLIGWSDISDSDQLLIEGTLYSYEDGYREAVEMIPGKGYWVRARDKGIVLLGRPEVFMQAKKKNADVTYIRQSLESFKRLRITDATGNQQRLYFDGEIPSGKSLLSYTLPPVPPEPSFDVRFKGDQRLIDSVNATIEIQGAQLPVEIALENSTTNTDSYHLFIGEERRLLTADQPITFNVIPGEMKIATELADRSTSIPGSYRLDVNYPNPFNPMTQIGFSLPGVSNVRLIVYDALGRQVATLVNDKRQAGNYTVTFDAGNLSSGVYIYRIETEKYSKSRKMLLVK